MKFNYDIILIGIGLSNGLIAIRIRQKHPHLKILLIESNDKMCGNHTWSFHSTDLTDQQNYWMDNLVVHNWKGYHVRFPKYTRRLNSNYYCVTSNRLLEVLCDLFNKDEILLNTKVNRCSLNLVHLEDGRILKANTIIDGRGYKKPIVASVYGFQVFLGQEWKLDKPHNLKEPILIDATVDQKTGCRFVYTLPISNINLLIEDTYYINTPTLKYKQARKNIIEYSKINNWNIKFLLREEHGILPLTLSCDIKSFWKNRKIPCCGLRAGLSHPTTGYSLPLAVKIADLISDRNKFNSITLRDNIYKYAIYTWKKQKFFRILNRMLFLAVDENNRFKILQYFYRLPEEIIYRFYADKLTFYDKLRILSDTPPINIFDALRAIIYPYSFIIK